MRNNTKKALMLGALLLGCVLTSVIRDWFGNSSDSKYLLNGRVGEGRTVSSTADVNGYSKSKQAKTEKLLKIYVSGAVMRPGIYDIPQGSRAHDAVAAAGGTDAEADLEKINLAKLLKDGMQVNVPSKKSGGKRQSSKTERLAQGQTTVNNIDRNSVRAVGLVNINTASAYELELLPGIGPGIAVRIIEQRNRQSFSSVEDLLKVKGIGRAKLELLRDRVCV